MIRHSSIVIAAVSLIGCYSGTADVNAGAGAAAAPTGVPCDVSSLLFTYCVSCHNAGRAEHGIDLSSYEALTAMANGSETVAQRSLVRMHDTAFPMPPSPASLPSEAEVSSFEAWIASRYPRGSCGGADASVPDAGPSPYDTPTVCTSGNNWTGGNRESPYMRPGGECIGCHTRLHHGPLFDIAGTVYPTAHEPDDCNGYGGSNVTVVVIDATGREISLQPNAVGNFGARRTGLVTPYRAKVVFEGRELTMASEQTNGDCNACHTLEGKEMAPGRIVIP